MRHSLAYLTIALGLTATPAMAQESGREAPWSMAEEYWDPDEMAEAREDHYLALKVGKAAVLRGIDIGALAHPVGAIPETAKIESAGKALAYAVARQESEFRATAVSGAGARGRCAHIGIGGRGAPPESRAGGGRLRQGHHPRDAVLHRQRGRPPLQSGEDPA